VSWAEFTTRDDEALIAGLRAGNGPPVLLLHGGPGLGFDYLRDLAEELAEENDVAWYQQRGQAPSAIEGPHSVATDVEDARRVLDELAWNKAYVVGHSWGGHLALHVAEAFPDRLLGVLSVDPLGAIGDGRWPEFDEELFRRTPESVRARAREIDELSMKGDADDALALEGMRLVWPAYFADPEAAPPMSELRMASERSAQMVQSITQSCRSSRPGCPRFGCLSVSSTARGARCRSKLRRTRPNGFPAPGSRSSKAPVTSSGSRRRALFVPRSGGSPPPSF
jgi:pimeloyl-ACP methyl ester carboxylesterase